MMARCLLRPLILALTLFLSLSLSLSAATDKVADVCAHAGRQRDVCIVALSSVEGSRNATVPELAKISLNLTYNSASDAANYLSDIVEGLVEDPRHLACLSDCLDEYVDAVDQLTDAEPALDDKDYKDLVQWVQAAQAAVSACQDGCKAAPAEKTSKLTRMNSDVTNLCSVTISIVDLLQAKH